jgi:hypothetical protein
VRKISPEKFRIIKSFTMKIFLLLEFLLISFIGFCANDFGCGVGKPFVSALHHSVYPLGFAKITEFDAREIGAEHQDVVEFYVSMTSFSGERKFDVKVFVG